MSLRQLSPVRSTFLRIINWLIVSMSSNQSNLKPHADIFSYQRDVFLPQFWQLVGNTNLTIAGLELLPWTGTLVLFAPIAGKLVDHIGVLPIAICGVVLQGVGYLALAVFANQSYLWFVLPLMISGIGLSIGGPAMQKTVVGSVPRMAVGSASGLCNLFRLLGGAVGVPVSVVAFYCLGGMATTTLFTRRFTAAMIGAGVISLLGTPPLLRIAKS